MIVYTKSNKAFQNDNSYRLHFSCSPKVHVLKIWPTGWLYWKTGEHLRGGTVRKDVDHRRCASRVDYQIWVFSFFSPLFPGPATCSMICCFVKDTEWLGLQVMDWNTVSWVPEHSTSFPTLLITSLTLTMTKSLNKQKDPAQWWIQAL